MVCDGGSNTPVRQRWSRAAPAAGCALALLLCTGSRPVLCQTAPDSVSRASGAVLAPENASRIEAAAEDHADSDSGDRLLRFTGIISRSDKHPSISPRLKTLLKVSSPTRSTRTRSTAALSTERDAGEPVRWKPADGWYGPDHVAGFVSHARTVRNVDALLTAGRFRAVFGHGLAIGSGIPPILSAGRSAVSPGVRSRIGGYAGFSERPVPTGLAFRATTPAGFGIVAIVSSERLTASLDRASDGTDMVRDVSVSGLHTGAAALARRGRLRQRVAGAWIVVSTNDFSAGLLALRSELRSGLPLSPVLAGAPRQIVSVSASTPPVSCRISTEVMLRPAVSSEVTGRCRTGVGTLLWEWLYQAAGPAAVYGRDGRFIRDRTQRFIRAGWNRRFRLDDESTAGRVAVSGSMSLPGAADRSAAWNSSGAAASRVLRIAAEFVRRDVDISAGLRMRRTLEIADAALILGDENRASGRIRATAPTGSVGLAMSVGIGLSSGAGIRLGHTMAQTVGAGVDPEGRTVSGTTVAVEVRRRHFHASAALLTASADECRAVTCERLSRPRIYVYQRGVRDSFGLTSTGDDGHRWSAMLALFPNGSVVIEAQVRRLAAYHAPVSEHRSARIGAPPAESTYTLQLTFR